LAEAAPALRYTGGIDAEIVEIGGSVASAAAVVVVVKRGTVRPKPREGRGR
jgi:O-acetyl-ADP-ribose deacetylase (regulator of RNase III)